MQEALEGVYSLFATQDIEARLRSFCKPQVDDTLPVGHSLTKAKFAIRVLQFTQSLLLEAC